MAKDWFRSAAWDEQSRQDFEDRLQRSLPYSRPQYLRIKAHALLKTDDPERREGGRRLLLRLTDEYPDALDVPGAHESLGDSYRAEGRIDDAMSSYRAAIQAEDRFEGSIQGHSHQSLAEVLIQLDDGAASREAEHLLGQVRERLKTDPFYSDHFRYQVARARLAHKTGDPEAARSAAVEALRLAAIKDPPLPRHPDLGLVKSDERTLSELGRIAAGDVSSSSA